MGMVLKWRMQRVRQRHNTTVYLRKSRTKKIRPRKRGAFMLDQAERVVESHAAAVCLAISMSRLSDFVEGDLHSDRDRPPWCEHYGL